MKLKKYFTTVLAGLFVVSGVTLLSACGGSKKGYTPAKTKVSSGSGMGNQNHKNKHVWGK